MTPEIILAAVLAVPALLVVLLVLILLTQRHATRRLEAIEAARAADRSPALLQQQIEALREQFARSLEANTQQVNQQLNQMTTTVGQR